MIWSIILCSLFAYCIWTVVHELAHALAAKLLLNATNFKFTLYPHVHERTFYFARVSWLYTVHDPKRQAIVFLSPRVLGVLGSILLPLTTGSSTVWYNLLAIALALGAAVDTFVGSLGISSTSDLRRASACLNINPWFLRSLGFLVMIICVVLLGIKILA